MKIDLINLKEGKNRIHLEEDVVSLELPDEIVSKTAVRIDGSLLKQDSHLILKTEVLFVLETECSRCLEPFQHPLHIPIEGYYQIGGEKTVQAADGDIISIPDADQWIDLTRTVREAIMLEIPIKPLCHEACKGLCPRCGTNLNSGTCKCMTSYRDSRWAALESLRGEMIETGKTHIRRKGRGCSKEKNVKVAP